jgi:hypothetical protein
LKRFGRIAIKAILWIVGIIIFLLLLVIILIQVPAVQNFAKDKAVTYLQNKIHTKVRIGHINLGLPKLIELDSVYFEDQKKDTLLAADQLKLNISLLKLFGHKLEINEINLKGINVNVQRSGDSIFNFDYIIKAFTSAEKPPVKPPDTTSAMKISLDKIILDKINIGYNDLATGNNVKLILGHFDTRFKDFDLDKMKFSIPRITLSNVDAKIIQIPTGPPSALSGETATQTALLVINLGTADLSKIKIDYRSNMMTARVDLGKSLLAVNRLDLKKQIADIPNISLENTTASLSFAKPQTAKKAVLKTAKKSDSLRGKPQSNKGWTAMVRKTIFINDNIQYDDNAQKPSRGLDYSHLNIRYLNADLENLLYSADTISGKVNNLTFTEKSGLKINKFHTSFFYGQHKSFLNDLYLETPHTVIQKRVEVGYPSLASISKNIGQIRVNANLGGSRISSRDVLLIIPQMATMEPFKSSPNAVFRINGMAIGKVNNMRVSTFELSGLSNTHVKVSGTLKGLPDVNKAYVDLASVDLTTSRADISKLVAAGMIPSDISIPENLSLKGSFKGSMKNFSTDISLRSSDGGADLEATLNSTAGKGNEAYAVSIQTNSLNVGALTKQPQMLGNITITANIKGEGTDPSKANLQFEGTIDSAFVKGYNYTGLTLQGKGINGNYTITARMKDPNIDFSLDARADLSKKQPAVSAALTIDSIDLRKLNLTQQDTRIHGKIIAEVPTADPDYLNADVRISELLLVKGGKRIKVDTIDLVSTASADSSSLRIKTPMLNAHMAGTYKLSQTADALKDVLNKYFNRKKANTDSARKMHVQYTPQKFDFDVKLVRTPLLVEFAPDLKELDPILINGHFDSQAAQLIVNGSIPEVVYGTREINNMKLGINAANNEINYDLTADRIKASSSINLLYTSLAGNAKNDKLNVNLKVRDANRKERYSVAGTFSILPNEYQFSFLPDGLMLDYARWAVSADNAFQFGNNGILVKNFSITNKQEVLSIQSAAQETNSPIRIDFKNFRIETFTRAAKQDSLQIGGVINGNAEVSDFQESPIVTTALTISDFSFKGDTIGNIAIKVNKQGGNAFAANVNITGKGSQVELNGLYYTGRQSRFDANINIEKLNMKSIEGFSFGSIKNAGGNITGKLKITGTTNTPAIAGDIHFNKVGFNVTMLNSYFRLPDESITFSDDGLHFNNFTLVDSTGNKAVLTGAVYTKTYTDFSFGLNVHADNFRVINSTVENNKLYFGKLYINADIKLSGNMASPVVDARLNVNEKTDMTIVLPQTNPGVEDRNGVVEFVNPNAPETDSILLVKQLDSLRKTSATGMNVSANININKAAKFTVVIDAANGDVVHLQGQAQLNGGIDPSGKNNLTGTYTVETGSYNLSYATVKRKFNFKKGSTVTWTGDPTSANINLTAVYVAKVPPIDLVSNQLSGSDNQTMYKQPLPFNVNLTLKNQLLNPNISFDIVLPDSTYSVTQDVVNTVDARLAQIRLDTNELNKQVLGVLVLGHFINDNPLQSQAGSSVKNQIKNSVSSLLTDQLNRMAGSLIKGVDLNFGLTSGTDYSSGTEQNRTDLNVALSKRFMSDRLTVTVGNNFSLEQTAPGEKSTNLAGNVSVGYKLSKDGRYALRAYRVDQFEVIEGQVIETGLTFILTVDYNRLSQIFAKQSEQEKALQKQYKQEQKQAKKQGQESN